MKMRLHRNPSPALYKREALRTQTASCGDKDRIAGLIPVEAAAGGPQLRSFPIRGNLKFIRAGCVFLEVAYSLGKKSVQPSGGYERKSAANTAAEDAAV
jgi:hypothetical protein